MPSFEEMFMDSKGAPIEYQGKLLVMEASILVSSGSIVRLTRESTNSEWKQGVRLEIDGAFKVDGRQFDKCIVLWEDTAPVESEIEIVTEAESTELFVRNVWDPGDGVVHSWHHGAAMIRTSAENGLQFHCNDGHPDEDFDDIIFRVETVWPSPN